MWQRMLQIGSGIFINEIFKEMFEITDDTNITGVQATITSNIPINPGSVPIYKLPVQNVNWVYCDQYDYSITIEFSKPIHIEKLRFTYAYGRLVTVYANDTTKVIGTNSADVGSRITDITFDIPSDMQTISKLIIYGEGSRTAEGYIRYRNLQAYQKKSK